VSGAEADDERLGLRGTDVSVGGWGRDVVVGWHAPWGPSLGRVVRGQSGDRSATDVSALVLGAPSPTAPRATPRLVPLGERLACAWIDDAGGALALLDEPHDHMGATPATIFAPRAARGSTMLTLGERRDLGRSARAIATAPSEGGRAWIAMATPEGVVGGTVSREGRVTFDEAPWIARQGAVPRLGLADVRGQPILCAVVPGERELMVVRLEDGRAVTVTHRLDHRVADLAVEPAGSRLAVALVESEGARVLCAYVDARGRLTERPVAQIDRYAGEHVVSRIEGASVVWVDDAFRLIARDAAQRTAFVLPFLGPVGERVGVVGRVAGPPQARFVAPRLEIAAVAHDDDEGWLLLARTKVDGSEAAPLELRLAPPFEVARERGLSRAHACCVEVARTLAGASYRDTALVAETTTDGARLALESTGQSLELRFLDDREFLVSLTTRGDDASLAADESSFGKLARWVRQRLSSQERTLAAHEAAWAARIANELGEGRVRESEIRASSTTGAVLEVVLDAAPRPDVLGRWIQRVREDLTRGLHRTPLAP
jgi:hypothetical protein